MVNHYIPSVDELHVGFECKIKEGDTYVPYVITTHTILNVPISDFRVKWLDKQDLLDLGFSLKKDFDSYSKFYINVPHAEPLYYTVEFEYVGPNVYITIYDNYNRRLLEHLWIRNKNELKWILNRYGILTKNNTTDS